MNEHVRAWRDEQKHLPVFMRDFHDCKDLFKAMHSYLIFPDDHPAGDISWVLGHQYIIDGFLWFMAEHGYTLQNNRSKLDFSNLDELIKNNKARTRSSLINIMNKGIES